MKLKPAAKNILALIVSLIVFLLPMAANADWEYAGGFRDPSWNWGGAGTTVSYSFATVDYGISYSSSASGIVEAIPESWKSAITGAFNEWSSACGLNFTEVADSGTDWNTGGAIGDIRIGITTMANSGTIAYAFYPTGGSGSGDMHFGDSWDWYTGNDTPGGTQIDLFSIALHEIGHAIGLGHYLDDPTSVMYPYYNAGTAKRELTPEVIAAAQTQYGASSATPEPGTMMLFFLCLGSCCFMSIGRNERF